LTDKKSWILLGSLSLIPILLTSVFSEISQWIYDASGIEIPMDFLFSVIVLKKFLLKN
jgi:hypothetical protein